MAVAQLFDRVAARHERALDAAGVQIETSIEPGATAVIGDRDRLEQALQNLAANAIRYAPRGHDDPADRARAPARRCSLSVEDEGAGIAAEHLPHIFDRFYKADAARAGVAGGSGLGLSIVKAIVERHGARIGVDSRPRPHRVRDTVRDATTPADERRRERPRCWRAPVWRFAVRLLGAGVATGFTLVADPLAQPEHRLRLAGDERLPLGFRQGDGDDAVALVAHGSSDGKDYHAGRRTTEIE